MESKRSKYILIGMSVFCILLIVVTSFRDSFLEPLRTGVGYFLIPVQSGVNRAGTLVMRSQIIFSLKGPWRKTMN